MTPDKLHTLAREAGLSVDGDRIWSGYLDCVAREDLARFAALVLEEAAKVCEAERVRLDPYEDECVGDGCNYCAEAIRWLAKQEDAHG